MKKRVGDQNKSNVWVPTRMPGVQTRLTIYERILDRFFDPKARDRTNGYQWMHFLGNNSDFQPLESRKNVMLFVYSEADKRLHKAKGTDILKYLQKREPWEKEESVVVFDQSLKWCWVMGEEGLVSGPFYKEVTCV